MLTHIIKRYILKYSTADNDTKNKYFDGIMKEYKYFKFNNKSYIENLGLEFEAKKKIIKEVRENYQNTRKSNS